MLDETTRKAIEALAHIGKKCVSKEQATKIMAIIQYIDDKYDCGIESSYIFMQAGASERIFDIMHDTLYTGTPTKPKY